jgi:hypothetical protein
MLFEIAFVSLTSITATHPRFQEADCLNMPWSSFAVSLPQFVGCRLRFALPMNGTSGSYNEQQLPAGLPSFCSSKC